MRNGTWIAAALGLALFSANALPAGEGVRVERMVVNGMDQAKRVIMAGDPAEAKPETPEQKQTAALNLVGETLRERKEDIREEILESAEVKKAVDTAAAATGAFYDALDNDKGYLKLKEEQADLKNAQRNLWRGARGKKDFRERREEMKKLREEQAAIQEKIFAYAETNPELAALQKKKDDALVAFWDLLQTKLDANPEYAKIDATLDAIRDAQADARRQAHAERMAKYRAMRQKKMEARNHAAEEKGEQGEAEKPAPKKVEVF